MIKLVRKIEAGHRLSEAVFSRKGGLIGAAGRHGATIWQAKNGVLMRSLPLMPEGAGFFRRLCMDTRAFSVCFSADASKVATGNYNHTVTVWDLNQEAPPMVLQGHRDFVPYVQFSDPGQELVSFGNRDKTVRVWDTSSGVCKSTVSVHGWGGGAALSPDATAIAVGDCLRSTFTLYDMATGQPLVTLGQRQLPPGFLKGSCGVAFSPDGATIVTGMSGGIVELWDVKSGTSLLKLGGHESGTLDLAFSPDGRHILSLGLDGTVRLWDLRLSSQVHCFEGQNFVASVCFSPGGGYAAFTSILGSVYLWDLGLRHASPTGGTAGVLGA